MRTMVAEICNGRYCEENGYFCRFMDQSGYCIATNCRRMIELDMDNIVDQCAWKEEEMSEGRSYMKETQNDIFKSDKKDQKRDRRDEG